VAVVAAAIVGLLSRLVDNRGPGGAELQRNALADAAPSAAEQEFRAQ